MSGAVPDELLSRFRTIAMDRLERIDETWTALVRGHSPASADGALLRDVHTLKGDAKVIGLSEASLLCQRLEDLLDAARARGYRVHEDVDVVVTMTIQFIAMLVRKRSTAGAGIDLSGFLEQIEEVMSEWLRRAPEASDQRAIVGPHLRVKDRDRIDESSGLRLSVATTAVYLEHLRTTGETRQRLRETWKQLLDGVLEAHRDRLTSTIHGHVKTAKEIADALGKSIVVVIHGDETSVEPETAQALGVVLLHALRNAVDHGIELPLLRQHAGKPPTGSIRIEVGLESGVACLTIVDDGAGIDVERVRARAVERGLMSKDVAPHASPSRVIECLFAPGFSTRDSMTDISGRGIGLDAAHAAVTAYGGTLALESTLERGTTLRATVPDARGAIQVVCFESAFSPLRFAVPASFGVRRGGARTGITFEDVLRLPHDPSPACPVFTVFGEAIAFDVRAASKGVPELALRRCPTPPDELAEVVWVGDREVILVRPEVLRERLSSR